MTARIFIQTIRIMAPDGAVVFLQSARKNKTETFRLYFSWVGTDANHVLFCHKWAETKSRERKRMRSNIHPYVCLTDMK